MERVCSGFLASSICHLLRHLPTCSPGTHRGSCNNQLPPSSSADIISARFCHQCMSTLSVRSFHGHIYLNLCCVHCTVAVTVSLMSWPTSVFGRLFVKRFALCYQTVVCPVLSCMSVCVCLSVCLSVSVSPVCDGGRPRPHCVRWGLTPIEAEPLPQFSAHVCCGQSAGWIMTPLDVEVGLGPGHNMLDGDPPPKGHSPTILGRCLLWPNGGSRCHLVVGTWVDLSPGHFVIDGAQLPPERGTAAPSFRPMSIVAKWLPSQLLLSSC